jgi:hypothetical protein
MNSESRNAADYRYERKFVIPELTRHKIEALIKMHSAMFVAVYHPRYVNNLYLDTSDVKGFFANVDGVKDRRKVRIRWYGDLFGAVEKPALEIKIRNGSIGRKERFPLIPFSVDQRLQLDTIKEVFRKSDIPGALGFDLTSLELSLLNRYRRSYFQSVDRRCRISVDSELTFYQVWGHGNTFLHKSVDLINTVVELKYSPGEDGYVRQISGLFPFRMTKNSKYVDGVGRLCLW